MQIVVSSREKKSLEWGWNTPRNESAPIVFYLVALSILTFCSCKKGDDPMANPAAQTGIRTIRVSSPAFREGGMIPQRYTCDGDDVSPPLSWEAVPEGTKSIALIADDPDAPGGTFVHWVVYDLPADLEGLPENLPRDKGFPVGGEQGVNSTNEIGYMGLCPPSGTHRYFFRVYALDEKLNLPAGETKARLLEAMKGHILGQGQLMGRYKRQ
jgi:Raf kinase inhibitor-like YbhB/YbcL family protein